jgi:hypothetical protein
VRRLEDLVRPHQYLRPPRRLREAEAEAEAEAQQQLQVCLCEQQLHVCLCEHPPPARPRLGCKRFRLLHVLHVGLLRSRLAPVRLTLVAPHARAAVLAAAPAAAGGGGGGGGGRFVARVASL